MRDPYEVLGVAKDASPEEIKKVYRKRCFDLHPDRNVGDKEAEEKFKEVQRAYDTITGKEKPHQQDINMGFGGADFFNDFVNNVFGGGQYRPRQQRTFQTDYHLEIAIDFWEGVRGCEKTLTVPKFKTCETCSGSGAAEVETCSHCAGKGVIVQRQGFVTMQTTCPRCVGAGQKVKKNCEACQGKGSTRSDGTVTVRIPEGICNGTILKLAKQGNEHLGQAGDLYLTIRVNPHDLFHRQGDNLVYTMPITYSQAVLGAMVKVPTLNGEVDMAIPPGQEGQSAIIVPGKGFKNLSTNRHGDLVVWVEIETICADKEEYRQLVEALAKWENENESPGRKNFRSRSTLPMR